VIRYLTEKQIAEVNYRLIDRYSPNEEKAIKNPAALNMIVNLPEQYVFGQELYPHLFDKASVIFIQLVLKHVFGNANKRTATFVLINFLRVNGYDFETDFDALKDLSIKVAVEGFTDDIFVYVKNFISTFAKPINR
jgi:death-on-curing protein